MLEIPFDPYRLYATEDRDYVVWFAAIVESVYKVRKEHEATMKRRKK